MEERAAQLGRRSIKTTAKQQGIRLAVSLLDLTTLEGADTAGKVRHLCAKAVCPAPTWARSASTVSRPALPEIAIVVRPAQTLPGAERRKAARPGDVDLPCNRRAASHRGPDRAAVRGSAFFPAYS